MASPARRPRITRVHLPGIGKRTELLAVDGSAISVVEHPGGRTDLQVGEGPTVRMSGADAQALGALLTGTFSVDPSLLDDLHAALGGLRIDAVTIARDGPLAGRSIGTLEIRKRHRVTVVAVLHGSLADVAPAAETLLQPGDRAVVIGRPQDVDDFLLHAGATHGP